MASPALPNILDRAVATLASGPIAVAFSGGMDSSALLHALAASAQVRSRGLRAIHVDHGLHADSAQWADHCTRTCLALSVAIDIRKIEIDRARGTGIEDAARAARMAAFAQALQPGEFLALAQHRDDQAETILLKLLRGAGPQGLGGMRALRPLGGGWLWRPLLDLPRRTLRDYAQSHDVRWIDDPSNDEMHIERNFLRREILPRMRERWAEVEKPLAHSARWLQATADFVDAEAQKALARWQGIDPSTLAWAGWLALPDALRDPVLRLWLRGIGLDEPTHLHVAELERQLRQSRADRSPCIAFATTELRRYRDLLYAKRPAPSAPSQWHVRWYGELLHLPTGGCLSLQPARLLDTPLHVSYRRGGERIKPTGGKHTRDLRLLLQEAGVPPWRRDSIPLIHREGELLAVGDLVLSDAGRDLLDAMGSRIVWSPSADDKAN